jgi:hypothetical protein
MHFYPVNPSPVPSCADCGFLEHCGGLEGDDFLRGCFQRCDSHCRIHGCDVVCPSVPLFLGQLFGDVGGICLPPRQRLVKFNPKALPSYIPQINHGWQRTEVLNEPWITVPLYVVAGRDVNRRYDVRFKSGDELREALRLAPQTKIIITSVAPDRYIEDFWAEHSVKQIPAKLAQLEIAAMTVPNYSFMRDVPRTNSLYNLSRIFRAADAISNAGMPTILHLNASTRKDWERWLSVLKEQSQLSCVCLEFQTGTSSREIGDNYFAGLLDLQNKLGRALHPFVLAGGGRLQQLDENFVSFTVIDATPFIKTMKRQVLYHKNGFWKWKRKRTPLGSSLSKRLARSIELHRTRQLKQIGRGPEKPSAQLLLSHAGLLTPARQSS